MILNKEELGEIRLYLERLEKIDPDSVLISGYSLFDLLDTIDKYEEDTK